MNDQQEDLKPRKTESHPEVKECLDGKIKNHRRKAKTNDKLRQRLLNLFGNPKPPKGYKIKSQPKTTKLKGTLRQQLLHLFGDPKPPKNWNPSSTI